MHSSIRQVVLLRRPYAQYAFAFDAVNGWYKGSDGLLRRDPTLLPGYAYTRSGAKSELDANGTLIPFAANAPGIVPGLGYWSRDTLANLFLNNAVGVTQNVTVTAQAYTLSFFGTGTITLSGTSTAGPLVGTGVNNRVSLTFTPTAGTLTLTVSGSCTNVGVVAGTQPGPIIVTTGSTAAIGPDNLSLTYIPADEDFVIWNAINMPATGATLTISMFSDGTNSNRFYFGTSAGNISVFCNSGGVSVSPSGTATPIAIGRQGVGLRRRGGKYTMFTKSTAGAVTIGAESSAQAFPIGMNKLEVGLGAGGIQVQGVVEKIFHQRGTFSDADLTNIALAA